MKLKLISLPKTSTYLVEEDGFKTREEIISLSSDWSDNNITLFKKLAKQGGICRIGGLRWIIKVSDKVVDSKGYKDKGVGITPGPEKS